MDVGIVLVHHLSAQRLLKPPFRISEVASGIVCGCLPVLPQLFRHYLPKIRKSLIATLRSLNRSTPNDSHVSKGSRTDTWTQAPVKGLYIELDERNQRKDCTGTTGKGQSQGPCTETKITAHKDLYDEERSVMGKEIRTDRTVTVE